MYPNAHHSTVLARTWKQPRCPSADEWIRKLWYIYTMQYYSAIKKNTFELVLMRWMKLEPVIQSEVSQKEKHQYSHEIKRCFLLGRKAMTNLDSVLKKKRCHFVDKDLYSQSYGSFSSHVWM